jgi:preprotein translocase SecE subunit
VARTRKLPSKQAKLPKINTKPVGTLKKPFGAIWRLIKKIVRPFRFLRRPFKTRPVRFIGRLLNKVLLLTYFRQSWLELRQVTWPGRKETAQLTFAVFAFAIVFSIVIAIIDFGLDKLFKEVLI